MPFTPFKGKFITRKLRLVTHFSSSGGRIPSSGGPTPIGPIDIVWGSFWTHGVVLV